MVILVFVRIRSILPIIQSLIHYPYLLLHFLSLGSTHHCFLSMSFRGFKKVHLLSLSLLYLVAYRAMLILSVTVFLFLVLCYYSLRLIEFGWIFVLYYFIVDYIHYLFHFPTLFIIPTSLVLIILLVVCSLDFICRCFLLGYFPFLWLYPCLIFGS